MTGSTPISTSTNTAPRQLPPGALPCASANSPTTNSHPMTMINILDGE